MGIFNWLFTPKQEQDAQLSSEKLETLTTYSPLFTPFNGGVYESELIRSVIHAKAEHTAKLSPHILGSARKNFENILRHKPNPFQSTYDFLYRLRTLYEVNTYAFIIPLFGDDNVSINGLYPLDAENVVLMENEDGLWLRYRLRNGDMAAIEYDRVAVMKKMNYKNEFSGDGNSVLRDTMNLLDLQSQGIQDAIKQSAKIRFIARIGQNISPKDIEKERKRFSEDNLSRENDSGVLMFDQKYQEVKQVESDPYIANDKTIAQINQNVFSYWGINEDILQNKFNEDTWNAFYEGEIEPFAIQLSQALTNMLFTSRERANGNIVHFSANRLQYASNKMKLEVSTKLFDRGIIGKDDVAEIWNMPKTGDNRKWIRKEYAEMKKTSDEEITQIEIDEEINKEIEKELQDEEVEE